MKVYDANGIEKPGVNGATGAQGPQGPAIFLTGEGEQGETGPPGFTGRDGIDGPTGGVGPAGPAIFLVSESLDGEPGPPGIQGRDGINGPAGPVGLPIFLVAEGGEDGLIGPPGPKGATGSVSPLTTDGDIFYFNSVDDRLPIGTNGQVLTVSGLGVPIWQAPTGGADDGARILALAAIMGF